VSLDDQKAFRKITIPNAEGLHTRPVMAFVDLASKFSSSILVQNLTGNGERVDGKSAMQMMLLEGTQGSTLGIEAEGADAHEAADALARLVEAGLKVD